MPPNDRSPNPNGVRPQMPSLSAAAQRGAKRAPLTPKIAAKPPQTPAVGANTARRTQRPTTASSARLSAQEDDLSPFLANITPRSGSRQSRVDSTNSTPNGTPNPDRYEGWDRGSRSPNLDVDTARRPFVTFSPMHSEFSHPRLEAQNNPESKFFYASEAKSTQPAQAPAPPTRPGLAPRTPTFFYANDSFVEGRTTSPSPHVQVPVQDRSSNKFVYANGTPELRPSPAVTSSRPGSVVSTASRAPANRPVSVAAGGNPSAQRSNSPIKLAPPPYTASQKNSGPPPVATDRAQMASPPQMGPAPPSLRRTSTGTSTSRGGHSRAGSLVISEVNFRSSQISSGASSPSVESVSRPAPLTLASIIQAADDFEEAEEPASPDDVPSDLQSPTKSTHSADPVTDLVANARRERKVQDLQIRNGSLEAINRTLERQLRKQTAELRRYKRLSRSGRLSKATSTIESSVASDPLSADPGPDDLALSDLSEEKSAEDDDLDEDSLSDIDSTAESLSPTILAERDAKHQTRDEKLLQADLSKHQELLIDSQRINQSIKRCLDWTEELIKEGKKALDYHIRVSDVAIPPRVLRPADEEDDYSYIPDITPDDLMTLDEKFDELNADLDELERPLERPPRLAGWGLVAQDRDSGIEIPPIPVDGD
ncbi:uncharacterized protein BCR38DRAFT_353837 [Pseudomassariella vexata]|uniref:Uncharacterized protein n=1 Tax=Pseudomassariella vexata TaxID=1141098 RepID=A0A1Y2DFJ5_9PEZI|nr:uncharacterized protein BCR38DRAFT_353837 [Pseudomassariella vexata]ORY57916.1 hypothetical protein BCR38DRAFT_353837 [Pseudomassariella vexata]